MRNAILIVVLLLLLYACSNKLFQSNWKSSSEPTTSFRFYEPDSKIRYNLENDSNYLYFSFDVIDQLTIQKILTTGMRVFLDGSAKNKQRREIQFPIFSDKVPIEELEEYGNEYDQSIQLGKERLDQMIPTDGYLKIDGQTTQLFNLAETNGVQVAMSFDDSRSLVYRLRVPLSLINADSDVISIGVETGGYEMPAQPQADPNGSVANPNQPTAGDRAMGRGNDPYGINTPGGSTAAGMAMRSTTAYNKFAEPIRFWVKLKLHSMVR